MTALIVIGIIVLIFAVLLNFKIRAEVKFYGGELDFKVKYMFFTVFPFKKKEKKPKKEKPEKVRKNKKSKKNVSSKKAPEKVPDNKPEDEIPSGREKPLDDDDGDTDLTGETDKNNKPKKSLSEKIDDLTGIIEKVKIVWGASKKGLKKLFLNIYFEGLVIDFVIADEDAYKAALNYGRICAVVYNLINIIQRTFTTKIKTVDIVCDFDGKKSVFDGELKVTIKPATIFSSAFVILFGILKNFNALFGKKKVKKQPENKTAVTV